MATQRVVVVGGGLAGLTAAYALTRARPEADVVVLESSERVGGNVRTLRRDGCTVELGPDAFLTRPGHAEALCESLGLGGSLRAPDEGASRVMVAHRRGMQPLPDGMALGMPRSVSQLARTRLLSPLGKARAAMDLVLPARDEPEATVGALVGARFGREVKDHLVEPVVGGIYGGDIDELDAATIMPMFANVRGSLLRALASAPRPTGHSPMRAPHGGLDGVVHELARALGPDRVIREAPARRVARHDDGWSVHLDDGVRLDADELVLATPPGVTADLLEAEAPELSELLRRFRLKPALTVVMAFERASLQLPRASGALIPRNAPEPLNALSAVTFVDRKWPARVADHLSVVRTAFRPAHALAWMGASDADVVRFAREALSTILPLPEARWSAVERFETGTPCPEVGHTRRATECRARAAAMGGLSIVGAAVDGPGIAGCVRGATAAAEAIATRISGIRG